MALNALHLNGTAAELTMLWRDIHMGAHRHGQGRGALATLDMLKSVFFCCKSCPKPQ